MGDLGSSIRLWKGSGSSSLEVVGMTIISCTPHHACSTNHDLEDYMQLLQHLMCFGGGTRMHQRTARCTNTGFPPAGKASRVLTA